MHLYSSQPKVGETKAEIQAKFCPPKPAQNGLQTTQVAALSTTLAYAGLSIDRRNHDGRSHARSLRRWTGVKNHPF